MTKRRTRQTPESEPIEMAVFPPLAPPPTTVAAPLPTAIEERQESELEEILDEVGTSSRIKVWQIADGKSSYAGEMSGADFSLDTLLDTYGGGDKTLAIYQGRERRYTLKVSLDPTIPPKNPRTPKAVAGAAPQQPDMMGFMTAVAASQLQSSQAMTQMITGMVTAMASMMTATRPQKDPTEIAIEMAKLMGGRERETSPSDFLAAFRQGMEIGERVGGTASDDDGVMTAVHKGLDTLSTIVAGIVENNRNKAPQAAALSAPAPTSVVGPGGVVANVPSAYDNAHESGGTVGGGASESPSGLPETTMGEASVTEISGTIRPWVVGVRPYIGQLLGASKFLSPDAAAETINKNMSDDQFFDLIDDISDQENGGFGVRIAQYFPQVKEVDPNWIGAVIEVLLTEYVEADPDSDEGDSLAPPPDKAS